MLSVLKPNKSLWERSRYVIDTVREAMLTFLQGRRGLVHLRHVCAKAHPEVEPHNFKYRSALKKHT